MTTPKTIKFLNQAFSHYGLIETKGRADNPVILGFFHELGFKGDWVKDEVSWCSAFINHCAKAAGLQYTGKLSGMSWEELGDPVDEPELGDIVIFWRGASKEDLIPGTDVKKRHVAIYVNHDDRYYYVLGGNQSNMVCISAYPKQKVVAIRRLESKINQ